ncbi:MAG: LemA family protein [Opitutales bacterium]|nr:LemA family protein [Opitutales bacterium]
MIIAWILIGVAVLVIFWGISVYNGLVALRNRFKNAFAQIDVQLQRRYDLIPNLVETAKGFLAHEKETLQAVTEARNIAQAAAKTASGDPANAAAIGNLSRAEGVLGSALSRLMMVCEAYPDLKSDRHMAQLMEELSSTENKISFARQAYNDAVMLYNNGREVFPASLVAGMFGFLPAELLALENAEARQAVKVQF